MSKTLPTGAAKTFRRQIEAFREYVHGEIHPVQMMVFVEVCTRPPLSVNATYIQHELGLSQAAASRACRALSERASPSREGYGLCRWVGVPEDARAKYLELTEKGEEVRDKLREVFTK